VHPGAIIIPPRLRGEHQCGGVRLLLGIIVAMNR
jgi:hypothetical protein